MLAFDLNTVPWGWLLGGIVTFGTAIGLIIAYYASREYIRQTTKILKETIVSQQEQLKAEKELAKTLAHSHSTAINLVESKLTVMTSERDNYRDELHIVRGVLTPLQLELQELKLRPDLNTVLQKEEAWHTRREQFYADMSGNQRSIIEAQRDCLRIIGEIKTGVETELKQSNEVCTEVGKALQNVVEKMDLREDAAAERDAALMGLLQDIKSGKIVNGDNEN